LIKKQVKKELEKAKPAPPAPADELHEHLEALHKSITAGHNEVVRALQQIGQAAVHPVVVEQVFKPPEVLGSLSLDHGDGPADLAAVLGSLSLDRRDGPAKP